MAEGSPTVRRRELGALLRGLREKREMSVKQVTEHLLCSPSKVSRIETGQRGATLRDVRDLCDLYGVTDQAERDHLMNLAREGKQQGWWQSYDLPFATPTYVGLEAEAVHIKDYDSGVIPGLLQTPGYVRALHDKPLPEPAREATPDLVDRRVEARLRRQELLTREEPPPLQFWAILDEAVLHRVVGGPSVMQTQLELVVERMRLPNVTVQVLPYSVGAHPALDSTFNILEFSGPVSNLVYSEGLAGFMFIERPEDVDRYQEVFERLSQMSLSPRQSADLMMKVNRQYKDALRAAS
ncbi:MAG: helix-turn-helix domain-containing protein [Streptosporangiaceae bacterium]